MRTTRTLVLVDLDGVVNALQPELLRTRTVYVSGYRIQMDRRLPALFSALEGLGAELRWSSMWGHDARKVARALRLGGHWPTTDFDDYYRESSLGLDDDTYSEVGSPDAMFGVRAGARVGSYKFRGWRQLTREHDGPVVILDDDLLPEHYKWAERRTLDGQPVLLVRPDPWTGLTPAHLALVTEFVATLAPRGSGSTNPSAA
jgi:hypothetical protein